jgi:hypothetical protein
MTSGPCVCRWLGLDPFILIAKSLKREKAEFRRVDNARDGDPSDVLLAVWMAPGWFYISGKGEGPSMEPDGGRDWPKRWVFVYRAWHRIASADLI